MLGKLVIVGLEAGFYSLPKITDLSILSSSCFSKANKCVLNRMVLFPALS